MKRLVVAVATAVAVLVTSAPSHGQTAPPAPVEQPALDPADGGNPSSPLVVLPPVVDALDRLQGRAGSPDAPRRESLRKAAADTRQALEQYTDGSSDIRAGIGSLAGAARHVG